MYTLFSSFFSRDFDAIKAFASHSMKKNRKNGMDMAVVDYMMYLAYSVTKLAILLSFSQYEYMQQTNNFFYFAIKKSINLRKKIHHISKTEHIIRFCHSVSCKSLTSNRPFPKIISHVAAMLSSSFFTEGIRYSEEIIPAFEILLLI